MLISFAVIANLICVFVFAYAKRWFSHDAAQFNFSDNDNPDMSPGVDYIGKLSSIVVKENKACISIDHEKNYSKSVQAIKV